MPFISRFLPPNSYQRVQFSFVKSRSSNLFQQEKLALRTASNCNDFASVLWKSSKTKIGALRNNNGEIRNTTLPSLSYQEKLPIERVSLRTKTRDGGEDPSNSNPAGSNEAGTVDEEEQEDGTDLSDEFVSDESDNTEDEPASNESTRSDI